MTVHVRAQHWLLAGLVASSVACAYQPSQELLTARNAYDQVSKGPAATLVPADLHEAHAWLQSATDEDYRHPGSEKAKDYAYIATRKAEWAQARAETAGSKKEVANSDKELQETQTALLEQARRVQQQQGQELQVERLKAQQAMAELAQREKVTKDQRGEVITLPSGLLFETGSSVLLPGSHRHLNQVAEALNKTNRTVLIEGHTDSTGGEEMNLRLSERRANAVADYLVAQGVDESRINARGAGKSRPIADNTSAEGRAINRRVEIVVQPARPSTVGRQQP